MTFNELKPNKILRGLITHSNRGARCLFYN